MITAGTGACTFEADVTLTQFLFCPISRNIYFRNVKGTDTILLAIVCKIKIGYIVLTDEA